MYAVKTLHYQTVTKSLYIQVLISATVGLNSLVSSYNLSKL